MLNPDRLSRMLNQHMEVRLVEEILLAGRPVSLPIRLRLLEAAVLPYSALGLGLERLIELSYNPADPAVITAAQALLTMQHADGSFGSPGVTAIALRTFAHLQRRLDSIPSPHEVELGLRLAAACDHAHTWLASCTDAVCSTQRTDDPEESETLPGLPVFDDIEAALVIWQLEDTPDTAGIVERLREHFVASAGPRRNRLQESVESPTDDYGMDDPAPGVEAQSGSIRGELLTVSRV